jgi:hypothetical protein
MEKDIEIKGKLVTPLGDFNCQTFPILKSNKFFITDEQLDLLNQHKLKWAYDEDTIEQEEIKDKPIRDTESNEIIGFETREIVVRHPKLVENDNTIEEQKANALKRIEELKALLKDSDYRAIKYAEGFYTDEEYSPYKEQRQVYRDEINSLLNLIEN